MNVYLIDVTAFPEDLCGVVAAVCTDSNNYERSLRHALESGHTSVLEHAVYTFKIEDLSRAALAQLGNHFRQNILAWNRTGMVGNNDAAVRLTLGQLRQTGAVNRIHHGLVNNFPAGAGAF